MGKMNLSTIAEQKEGESPPLSPVATDPVTIDKSLEVRGEVIRSESLYIDGKVTGMIYLPGSRVTIGRNGQVSADICAVRWRFWGWCMGTSKPATV
jgi:cytoskeletal protein CcmA (bactofilin family)